MNTRLFTALALAGASAAGVAQAQIVNTIGTGNTLVTVSATAPGTLVNSRAITGVGAGETLLGLDYRPANSRVFYSTSSTGQLYAVNPFTGAATRVGAPIALPAGATAAAYDFNPTVDRLRVVTNNGVNLRLNPDTGAVAGVDTSVAYRAGDSGAGIAPRITGTAYTANVVGGGPTTMYVIDSGRATLGIQGSIGGAPVSPNSGQLTTVGQLGVNSTDAVGFDISGRTGQALATLTAPGTGVTSLYSVNLATGAATLLGTLPGNTTFVGLSFAPAATSSFATNANAAAVGVGIDSFVGLPGAGQQRFFNVFDALATDAERGAALNQFTPAPYSVLPDLLMRTAEFQQQATLRYLRDYRAGGTGVEGQAGEAAPGDRRFGSWLVARGTIGEYEAAGDRPELEFGEYGVMGGIDGRFGEKSVIGISGGYQVISPRFNEFTVRSSLRNWFAGGYGSFAAGPAYIDLYGSYGEGDMDLRRSIVFGPNSEYLTGFGAGGSSRTWVAGGQVGLSFNFAGFEIEPTVGVRYTDLLISQFNETIAAVGEFGGILIPEQSYKSVLGNLGLRVGAAIELGAATLRPEIRGAWRREFNEDDARVLPYSITGVPGTLAYTTTPLGRDFASFGAGFTVSGPGSPLSFVVDYNGEAFGGREIHGITGGLRLTF